VRRGAAFADRVAQRFFFTCHRERF
jgi:hypothetical protein